MKYTKIPIIIYFGDNLPKTPEHPEQYEWTIRLKLCKQWAAVVNKHGGNVTVVHLPEIRIYGNTHFPMSDLNNEKIAELAFKFLEDNLE